MKTQIMSRPQGGAGPAAATDGVFAAGYVAGTTDRTSSVSPTSVDAGVVAGATQSDHHPVVGELVDVLRDELSAHHQLLKLELTKREAIIARDGEVLKQSANDQARELHKIDLLESRRDGRWIYYRLAEDRHAFRSLVLQAVAGIPADHVKRDRENLQPRKRNNGLHRLQSVFG